MNWESQQFFHLVHHLAFSGPNMRFIHRFTTIFGVISMCTTNTETKHLIETGVSSSDYDWIQLIILNGTKCLSNWKKQWKD